MFGVILHCHGKGLKNIGGGPANLLIYHPFGYGGFDRSHFKQFTHFTSRADDTSQSGHSGAILAIRITLNLFSDIDADVHLSTHLMQDPPSSLNITSICCKEAT